MRGTATIGARSRPMVRVGAGTRNLLPARCSETPPRRFKALATNSLEWSDVLLDACRGQIRAFVWPGERRFKFHRHEADILRLEQVSEGVRQVSVRSADDTGRRGNSGRLDRHRPSVDGDAHRLQE